MVKVGSMRRAKRVLLVAAMLLLVVSGLEASLFRRKAKKPAEPTAAVASAMSLSAVESDASRILLRTSGTPVYTSYSPLPDVFIVDLTSTSRPADLAIPTTLPFAVSSIAAEEVTEMGSRLTRVTFRLSQPVALQASAADNSVIVSVPALTDAVAPAEVPAVAPVVTATVTETPAAEPVVAAAEPVIVEESPAAPVAEPVAVVETASLPKAKQLKAIETSGSGESLELRIAGDGALTYKTFRLESPSRLVIDLNGVMNAAKKNALTVDDPVVKKVRVAQFKGAPDPVTRVVVDLAGKTEYTVTPEGKYLRVSFSGAQLAPLTASAQPAEPVVAPVETPKPAPKVVVSAPPPPKVTPTETRIQEIEQAERAQKPAVPADVTAQVPAIAENAWRMPEASKGARPVITSGGQQAPPPVTQTPAGEDVFDTQTPQNVQNAQRVLGQGLGGSRTLSAQGRQFTGEPLSLNLKDADIKDVLRTFAQLTGLNVAVDPGVRGTVTVDFADVPWDQALDIILRQNGLTYVLEGNVMRIGTIERLAAEAAATRRLAEEERLNVPTTTVIFQLSYARATEVQNLLREISSPRARIIVDSRTNQLIVTEIASYLQTMRNLIDTIDVPTRQVLIEARIVETAKQFQQQYGFSFGFRGALDPSLGTGTGLLFPNRIGYSTGASAAASLLQFTGGAGRVIGVTLTDVLGSFTLDFALHAAETEGLVRVVSAPRVMTQDNVPATIQSGLQIPYQTRVNFTTTVTYVDATLKLAVTPQITQAGTVIMDIQLQKIEPFTAFSIEGAAGTSLSTRTASTRLMVRDGATSVIGGIYSARDNNQQTRLPFLHQIPVIGALFRGHNVTTNHDELLIFITPRIVRG